MTAPGPIRYCHRCLLARAAAADMGSFPAPPLHEAVHQVAEDRGLCEKHYQDLQQIAHPPKPEGVAVLDQTDTVILEGENTGDKLYLSRDYAKRLWRDLEKHFMKEMARPLPETGYMLIICPGCGAARVETGQAGNMAVSGGRNYPKCGCGGEVFEKAKLVARRKMVVEWEKEE